MNKQAVEVPEKTGDRIVIDALRNIQQAALFDLQEKIAQQQANLGRVLNLPLRSVFELAAVAFSLNHNRPWEKVGKARSTVR